MKKKEFLDEIGKRFKYVHYIVPIGKGFDNLAMDEVVVAMVDYRQVYRDTISFWVHNEGKTNEEILDVKWKGSYFKIDTEIENVLAGKNIRYENEKSERRKTRQKILDAKEESY